jgi:hypothetical protein
VALKPESVQAKDSVAASERELFQDSDPVQESD